MSLTKFRNREPVLARGIGRLTFEFTADMNPEFDSAYFELSRGRKLEREIDQLLFTPVDLAEVNAGTNFANLIAYPMCDERSLGVIEDDALLLIEPALVLVDFGDDRLVSHRQDLVSQAPLSPGRRLFLSM